MTQKFSNEHEVRTHVKVLKSFYEELSFYAVICLGLVVIWLLSGAGYFWPIWIVVIWGVPLFLKASRVGVISESFYNVFNHLRHTLPIFKPEWEEQKAEQLSHLYDIKEVKVPAKVAASAVKKVVKKATTKTKPTTKKVTKAVAKKAAPAVKKVAPKVVAETTAKPAKKAASKKPAAKKSVAKKAVKKKK